MDVHVVYECGCTEVIDDDGILQQMYLDDDETPLELDGPCTDCGAQAWYHLNPKSFKAAL